jgi:hypothetical protein
VALALKLCSEGQGSREEGCLLENGQREADLLEECLLEGGLMAACQREDVGGVGC